MLFLIALWLIGAGMFVTGVCLRSRRAARRRRQFVDRLRPKGAATRSSEWHRWSVDK